jgi:hypothetical protein
MSKGAEANRRGLWWLLRQRVTYAEGVQQQSPGFAKRILGPKQKKRGTLKGFHKGGTHVVDVRAYILNQAHHHRHESFQDEFRRLRRKYGVAIDERYVWD